MSVSATKQISFRVRPHLNCIEMVGYYLREERGAQCSRRLMLSEGNLYIESEAAAAADRRRTLVPHHPDGGSLCQVNYLFAPHEKKMVGDEQSFC